MRTAGLPRFRKLYGRIEEQIEAPQTLTFNITASEERIPCFVVSYRWTEVVSENDIAAHVLRAVTFSTGLQPVAVFCLCGRHRHMPIARVCLCCVSMKNKRVPRSYAPARFLPVLPKLSLTIISLIFLVWSWSWSWSCLGDPPWQDSPLPRFFDVPLPPRPRLDGLTCMDSEHKQQPPLILDRYESTFPAPIAGLV